VSVFVLDTSACAALMRHDPHIEVFLRSLAPGDVALVPPVVAKIEYGIRRFEAGTRKRELLERDGTPIDDMDVAIAAVAVSHGAEVVTANPAHFSRINSLTTRNW